MKAPTALTPEYLAILYTAYKQLPPFDTLLLPPASKIKFVITKSKARYGRFDPDNMAIERTCICEYYDDQEDWFDDCPKEKVSIG